MRTKIATLVLCLVMSFSISAQQRTDSFFNYRESRLDTRILPVETQGSSFADMNVYVDAPLGNGVFILLAIGLVYVFLKRKEIV